MVPDSKAFHGRRELVDPASGKDQIRPPRGVGILGQLQARQKETPSGAPIRSVKDRAGGSQSDLHQTIPRPAKRGQDGLCLQRPLRVGRRQDGDQDRVYPARRRRCPSSPSLRRGIPTTDRSAGDERACALLAHRMSTTGRPLCTTLETGCGGGLGRAKSAFGVVFGPKRAKKGAFEPRRTTQSGIEDAKTGGSERERRVMRKAYKVRRWADPAVDTCNCVSVSGDVAPHDARIGGVTGPKRVHPCNLCTKLTPLCTKVEFFYNIL